MRFLIRFELIDPVEISGVNSVEGLPVGRDPRDLRGRC
jgi:hypothetical protein